MNETEEEVDEELSEWEDMLGIDPNEQARERSLDDATRCRWDVESDERINQEREELDTTLTYEIDERGRTHLKREMGFWEAVKLTFDSDSYLSTRSKAIIAGAYGFAIIGVPLASWGFAKGMTSLVGSPTVWHGLAFVALAVFYIRWAAKVLSE